MNGYPCKNAERGCKASVIKSKDDGKYHEIDENGNIGARHFCKFWPKEDEWKKEVAGGISEIREIQTQILLWLSTLTGMAKGQETEVVLGQLTAEIAKYKEIERQRSFKEGNKV